MGTETCKRCNHLTKGYILHTERSGTSEGIKTSLGCINRFFIFHIYGSRSNQQIAMNRRAHKNTFAHLGRQLKNCMRYMLACIFVQQHIFTFSCCNMQLMFADHIIQCICINTGCIDDNFRCFCLFFAAVSMCHCQLIA